MNLVFEKKFAFLTLLLFVFNLNAFARLDEGMYPLSDLNRVDLKKAGLKIDKTDIFNPGHIGLVDALIQVGGCTGSFISSEGLIITNHHCAFSAVQLASTAENDYLTNGFVARTKELEIEAKGLTIRITDSYEDVSSRVLEMAKKAKNPAERIQIIEQESKKIVDEAESKDPTIKAEVSEMFIGKSYVLFRYKTIQDVRLVYVPKRSIGEFGGETDNWIWPRHTGDFSFLRAYVSADGSPAKFSKSNVPYRPKKHLTINPNGVKEEDFAFILGYPGRTFRHRPAQYIKYQERFLLPYTASLYEFQNEIMREAGSQDKTTELALATRIQRNSNVRKNYQGKMKGLKNIDLVNVKKKEDAALQDFIDKNPELKEKFGTLMRDIDNLYKGIIEDAPRELWLGQIYNSTSLLNVARSIGSFKTSMMNSSDPDDFFNKNVSLLRDRLNAIYGSFREDVDVQIFKKMIEDANTLLQDQRISAVDELKQPAEEILENTKLKDKDFVFNSLLTSRKMVETYSDDLLKFQLDLNHQIQEAQPELRRREGILNELMGDYVEVKELFQERDFIPDANSTLRLTFGYIRGYSPEDAVYMSPFTTIKGIVEKGRSGLSEYIYPNDILKTWKAKDFGNYQMKELGDVPVNILYNMDTTGGNSGSPIMNAYGELIGVNFDRAYDATINDFAWNESYSRSIGVDIRYVLWVADKIDNADFLLKEIGL